MLKSNPPEFPHPTGLGRRRARWRAAALGIFAAGFATAASAQVIEIATDGTAVTYVRPAIFTAEGAQPIEPPRSASASAQPAQIRRFIAEAAERQHLAPDLVSEVAWRESRFHQAAVSPRDAVGVMQLTAGTARALGVDRYDVAQNIHGGAAYLRGMLDRYRGDVKLALAAYNAGPGAVDRYGGVPPFRETQDYVAAILARLPQRTLASITPVLLTR